jgi:hypothetical protein
MESILGHMVMINWPAIVMFRRSIAFFAKYAGRINMNCDRIINAIMDFAIYVMKVFAITKTCAIIKITQAKTMTDHLQNITEIFSAIMWYNKIWPFISGCMTNA